MTFDLEAVEDRLQRNLADRSTLTNLDHRMIHLAAARGVVRVLDGGEERTARLVAWKPRRGDRRRNVARVEFAPGRRATVKPECVQPVGGAS